MEKLSISVLTNMIKQKEETILKLKIQTVTDKANKNDYDVLINAEKEEIEKIINVLGDKDDENEASTNDYSYQCLLQAIQLELKSIRKFEPGTTVETFILGLENLFTLQVKGKTDVYQNLEKEFTTMATSRMHNTYQSTLINANKVFNKFEDFREYMLENYSSQESNFQILSNLYSLDFKEHESYRDFGARLDIEVTNACTSIMANWSKENATSDTPSPILDAKGLFSLFSGMMMSERIKQKSPDIYRLLLKRINKFKSAASIAAEAQQLHDRQADDNVFNGAAGGYGYFGAHGAYATKGGYRKMPDQEYISYNAKKYQLDEDAVKEMLRKRICLGFNSDVVECKHQNCRFKHEKIEKCSAVQVNHYATDEPMIQFASLDF